MEELFGGSGDLLATDNLLSDFSSQVLADTGTG